MLRGITIFVLLLTFSTISFMQTKPAVNISPNKPQIEDILKVTYNNSAKNAVLKGADEITLHLLIMKDNSDEPAVYEEIPMIRKGNIFTAEYKIADKSTKALMIKFISKEVADDNKKDSYIRMIYNKKGKPVQGAYYMMSNIDRFTMNQEFPHELNYKRGFDYVRKELASYPNREDAILIRLRLRTEENKSKEVLDEVEKEIDSIIDNYKTDEKTFYSLAWNYRTRNKEDKYLAKTNEIIKTSPYGYIAQRRALEDIDFERDNEKRISLSESALKKFASDEFTKLRSDINARLIRTLMNKKEYDRAVELMKINDYKNPSNYNTIAWDLIERLGQVEKGVEIAKIGVELGRARIGKKIDPEISSMYNLRRAKYDLSYILDTYAYGLDKLGKIKEAVKYYQEASELNEFRNNSINQRYFDCLIKLNKKDEAYKAIEKILLSFSIDEKLKEKMESLYLSISNDKPGFDSLVKKADLIKEQKLIDYYNSIQLNKTAPDFSLKSLDGKQEKLSSFKGKTVFIDFWELGCGPCRASHPTLQKIFEKYKDNNEVIVLTIILDESAENAKWKSELDKYLIEGKYTFPVFPGKKVFKDYKISGYPTKVFVDKDGKYQFALPGFGDEKGMITEVDFLINYLDKERHKSLNKSFQKKLD